MGEIKQTNFRVDQDTADAFRKFCVENGLSQTQGFDHIMHVVEMDRAKSSIPGRKTEIEEFERYVKSIMTAYLNSIEINNNAEARIREQFASALNRKDKTIDELQAKVEELQTAKANTETARIDAEKARKTAEEREKNAVEQMEAAKKNAADKERINTMLTSQLTDATEKLDGYDQLKESEINLRAKIIELELKINEDATTLSHTKEIYETRLEAMQEMTSQYLALKDEVSKLKIELAQSEKDRLEEKKDSEYEIKVLQGTISSIKEKATDILETNKSLTDENNDLRKKLEKINEEMIKQASEAKLETEKAVMAKERELHEQIRQSDKEIAKQSFLIEQLQEQIKQLKVGTEKEN